MPRSILDTIGHTPVVALQRLAPNGVDLLVKLESRNPLGSLKDRVALAIIDAAEASGELRPGQTVIEASSGNTGLSLAMVCAARGYPLVVVMAENFSVERRRLMRFLGARVVLTPAWAKGSGMLAKARELADAHGWFLARQFDNPANADVHARTTAREILADFDGERLDWLVTGAGTGGTLYGVAGVLRRERPDCRIAVCEPDNAPMLASGIGQPRDADGRASGSHPLFRPHPMQGWSPDFIATPTASAFAEGLVDRVLPVDGAEAIRSARELARREGILAGISGGATLAGARALARTLPQGSRVLAILPDTGERYLSTPLFESIAADMDDDEWAISRSTDGVRFDRPAPAIEDTAAIGDDPIATGELLRRLADSSTPALMFGLSWCEFCWSVRRLFERIGVPLACVDVDSPVLATDGLGNRIRACLTAMTGSRTLPQVFIGGEWIGGCSETFDAFACGALARRLDALGQRCNPPPDFDASRLLPSWLQKRRAAA
jgi:cysteine synthase